jgi:catechol 2,3-dioxygenase-like lactoylglutathione lyase family enzyme
MVSGAVGSRVISHVGMLVSNVDACIEFYADDLGFDRLYRTTLDNGVELGGVALDNTIVEFIHAPEGTEVAVAREQVQAQSTHLGITVQRLSVALETLQRKGVVVFDGPRMVGNATIAFALDPENRPVELIEFSGGEARAMDFLRPS